MAEPKNPKVPLWAKSRRHEATMDHLLSPIDGSGGGGDAAEAKKKGTTPTRARDRNGHGREADHDA